MKLTQYLESKEGKERERPVCTVSSGTCLEFESCPRLNNLSLFNSVVCMCVLLGMGLSGTLPLSFTLQPFTNFYFETGILDCLGWP